MKFNHPEVAELVDIRLLVPAIEHDSFFLEALPEYQEGPRKLFTHVTSLKGSGSVFEVRCIATTTKTDRQFSFLFFLNRMNM